jgi:biopolymer transport protein TolR
MIRTQRVSARRLLNEINITPFCDVLLVLLIIFMVTAQAMTSESTQNMKLPKSSTQMTTVPHYLVVRIVSSSNVSINNQPIPMTPQGGIDYLVLGAKIKALYLRDRTAKLVIKADRSVPYDIVYETIDTAGKQGVTDIALAGEHSE